MDVLQSQWTGSAWFECDPSNGPTSHRFLLLPHGEHRALGQPNDLLRD